MITSQVSQKFYRWALLLGAAGLVLILSGIVWMPSLHAQTPSSDDTTATPSPTLKPQTNYTSIFDAPSSVTSTPEAQATPYTSIFDSATSAAPSQATPVTSLFDTAPQTAPEATPYGSVFDSASSSVIQFQGEGLPDNAYCMGCHENPSLQMSLTSGETFSVAVNGDEYADSVHGQHGTAGYRCVRCHIDMNAYPHEQVVAESARELSIELSTSCARCHPDKYDETLDDVHVKLMVEGNENAAVCSDCHSAHNVKRLTDEQTGASLPDAHMTSAQMCENCHTQIYEQYSQSVHGSALLTGNTDVPACANCHGTHDTQGPSSDSSFRLFSPQICADCHADEKMMAKYDISTDVFDTYVADFHGTTVTIFQSTAPDQKFNAPVCIDCHGVHDIVHVDNAESPVIKENLVDTCQRCHPDASTNFPSAWLSHYQPSFKRTPLVALANLAYTIAIPGIVGGLGLFVVTDVRRRRADRRKDHHHDA